MRKNSEWCTASIRDGKVQVKTPSGDVIPGVFRVQLEQERRAVPTVSLEMFVNLDTTEEPRIDGEEIWNVVNRDKP